ncbi:hypothetical protein [Nocardioides sp.]|uniref:hypothetical protein n=1 Tax=Nocardioides sp. TaxID=35761 RepID=UPI0037850DA0
MILAVVAAAWWLVASPYWGGGDKTYEESWSSDGAFTQRPSISLDGSKITVYFLGGGCFKSATADAVETSESVTITVEVTDYADAACSTIGLREQATVSLSEPLGDRDLIDGALD